MAEWKHRLEWVDEANKTAGCSACGVVGAYYRRAQDRWQCVVARREQKGDKSPGRRRNKFLSNQDHAKMFNSQNGLCLICQEPMAPPCVDHDHATGRIRGMLCHACNKGLGCFRDNSESLARAIEYLA